jgi:hypothetical protein
LQDCSRKTPSTRGARGLSRCEATTRSARQPSASIATQEDIQFGHELLAITPDGRGIARWWVSTRVPGEDTLEENEGICLVTLDDAGLCTEFREWFNSRSRPA